MNKLISGDTIWSHIHENGGTYVTSGNNTGNYFGLFANTATVVSLICDGLNGTLTSIDIPAGAFYQFPDGATTVTYVSGKYTLYNL